VAETHETVQGATGAVATGQVEARLGDRHDEHRWVATAVPRLPGLVEANGLAGEAAGPARREDVGASDGGDRNRLAGSGGLLSVDRR
jgi:hypothetical protein